MPISSPTYTCLESADISSPLNFFARFKATSVLPVAVGPRITSSLYILCNKMKIIKSGRDYILLSLLFVLNLIVQSYNLGKLVFVFTDAGVYLYSAKLLASGLIPYQDFFLAQPPYLLYFFSGVLSLVNFDIKSFNFLYIIWGFLSIIPIYFITKKTYYC